jgi:histidinol-phosphate aminotransferase
VSVLEAMRAALSDVRQYPSPDGAEVTEALTQHLAQAEGFTGLDSSQVLCGNGSVALIRSTFASYVGAGDPVVTSWRSFEAYPLFATWYGAGSRHDPLDRVPLRRGSHDVDGLVARVASHDRALVLLTSPNNPGGSSLSSADVERILEAASERTLVVLDHAYAEFDRLEDRVDPAPLVREWPNLLVLRTMAKAYSLAGLRFGYAIGHPEVINQVRRRRGPFEINRLAEVAAMASIKAADEVRMRSDRVVAERDRVVARLLDGGVPVGAGQGNFVWLAAGSATCELGEALVQAGFSWRPFEEGGRVTIGTPEENDAWTDAVIEAVATSARLAPGGLTREDGVAAAPASVFTVADQRRSLEIAQTLAAP